jgi:hypothetical protein
MANSFAEVTPKLLAQGLLALRENCVMPRLINRSYENIAAQKGAAINVPIPSTIAVNDVSPAAISPTTQDSAPTSAIITLDQWKEAPFYLTDKDVQEAMDGIIPMQASEAVKAIANTIDGYLLNLYKGVWSYGGTAGTTPFGDGKTTDINQARKRLNVQLAPLGDRYFVFDPETEAAAASVSAFQNIMSSGDPSAIQFGAVQNKLGFGWFMDQNVPTHNAGTITTGLKAKAATAQIVGDKTIVATTAAATGACALVVGDIIEFAGSTQTYVVTAAATQATAATDVTISIEPGLVKALAGGEAVTVKAAHTVNLAFHRDFAAFATRPLEQTGVGFGNYIMSEIDPVSGLSLRLEITREHKRVRFSYDVLYGGAIVRPQLATRMAG